MPTRLPILRGRRFGCTQCGNCCVQDGFVYMTREEEARIAAWLALSPADFRSAYSVATDPESGLGYLEAKDGKGCPLLAADRRCTVHPVKPAQCKSWPFWPEMIEDQNVWVAAKSFCAGLDAKDGQRYSRREILEIAVEERGTE